MKTLLISYDLATPQQNKHAVASAIMMIGQSWARPLEQTWYIRADVEESDVEKIVGGLLGDEDGLLVQAVEKDVVLANTTLRWFKQRSVAPEQHQTNVVAFPVVPEKPVLDAHVDLAEAS